MALSLVAFVPSFDRLLQKEEMVQSVKMKLRLWEFW